MKIHKTKGKNPSHVFDVLKSGFFGELYPVAGQRGRNEGTQPGVPPVDPKHLPHVLLPTQVIVLQLVRTLVRRLSLVDVHAVIDSEGEDEEETEDTRGGHEGHAEGEGRSEAQGPGNQGHDHGEDGGPREATEDVPRVVHVEVVAVESGDGEVGEQRDEVTQVAMPDAVSGEDAVVVAAQHALPAHEAVERPATGTELVNVALCQPPWCISGSHCVLLQALCRDNSFSGDNRTTTLVYPRFISTAYFSRPVWQGVLRRVPAQVYWRCVAACGNRDFMQRRFTERRVNTNVGWCFMIGQCHGNGALFDVGVTCASNVMQKVPNVMTHHPRIDAFIVASGEPVSQWPIASAGMRREKRPAW